MREHLLISEREMKNMKKSMVSYVQKLRRALEKKVSDERLLDDQCSFIEPLKKNFQKADINQVLQIVYSELLFNQTCWKDNTSHIYLTVLLTFYSLTCATETLLNFSSLLSSKQNSVSLLDWRKNEYRTF